MMSFAQKARLKVLPDELNSVIVAGSERAFWLTLTILSCMSSDRISADFQYGDSNHTKKGRKVFIPKFYISYHGG